MDHHAWASGPRAYDDRRPRHADAGAASGSLPRRVLSIAEYADELRAGVKLSSAQCLELFGSKSPPIPVPLRPGETEAMYEGSFHSWMSDQKKPLLPSNERNFRTAFAQIQAHYFDPKNVPYPSTAARGVERYGPLAKTIASSAPRKRARPMEPSSSDHRAMDLNDCCVVFPVGTSRATKIGAFIQCGCSTCHREGERLVLELEDKLQRYASHEAAVSVVDLTGDAENEPSPRRVAVAISRLVRAEGAKDKLLGELTSSAEKEELADSVEERLLDEYHRINEELVVNQSVLESAASQLRSGAVIGDLQQLATLQDDNQELHDVIQGELKNRTAALAMAIAYIWRNDYPNLETLVNDNNAANSPRVQRALHASLDRISKRESATREKIEHTNKRSEEIIHCCGAIDRTKSLRRIGAELDKCDRQLRELRTEKIARHETLIGYDECLRLMIRTLIGKARE